MDQMFSSFETHAHRVSSQLFFLPLLTIIRRKTIRQRERDRDDDDVRDHEFFFFFFFNDDETKRKHII